MSVLGHDVLLRTVAFKGSLTAVEPIRIGAGKVEGAFSAVELPVIRVKILGREVPYIPGSSLKGVLRSISERIARGSGLSVCYFYDRTDNCYSKVKRSLEGALAGAKKGEIIKVLGEICIVCKAYGMPSFFSPINVFDAYPLGVVATGIKTGVTIDRRTGGAVRGQLFSMEYVEPGAAFSFEVMARNLPNYMLGLMAASMNEVNEGRASIGGMKSRGFGKAKILLRELLAIDRGTRFTGGRLGRLSEEDFDVEVPATTAGEDLEGFTSMIIGRFIEAWDRYVKAQGGR